MRNSDPRVRIVFGYRFNSNFHSIFTLEVTGCDFQYGPNFWVLPRIQPFGSEESSSLGNVYSRQATESVNSENSSVSFLMMYCPASTVVRIGRRCKCFHQRICRHTQLVRLSYYNKSHRSYLARFVFFTQI